jgi:hypothetical protein
MTTLTALETETPRRVRRERRRGWRMPANTLYVGRPTKFGNPFTAPTEDADGRHAAAVWFDRLLFARAAGQLLPNNELAEQYPSDDVIRRVLAGANLACWCPLDESCHADTLLWIANTPPVCDLIERDNDNTFSREDAKTRLEVCDLVIPSQIINDRSNLIAR